MVSCGKFRTLKTDLNACSLIRTITLLHFQLVCLTGHISCFFAPVQLGSFSPRVPLKEEVLRFLHDVICETTLTSGLNSSLAVCFPLTQEKENVLLDWWGENWVGEGWKSVSVWLWDSWIPAASVGWLLLLPNRLSPVVSAFKMLIECSCFLLVLAGVCIKVLPAVIPDNVWNSRASVQWTVLKKSRRWWTRQWQKGRR